MSIVQLIHTLKEGNIRIRLVEADLEIYSPRGAMNDSLLKELREKKADLIRYLQQNAAAVDFCPIEKVKDAEWYPMSHAQKRLWVSDQLEERDKSAYTIAGAYKLEGNLKVDALRKAFESLVERHEILRTSFPVIDGDAVQQVRTLGDSGYVFEIMDVPVRAGDSVAMQTMAEAFSCTPFNLSTGPLIRTRLVRTNSHEYVLLLTIHHIVCDAWSMEVILKDIVSLYERFVTGNHDGLRPLQIQYRDYSDWHSKFLDDEGDASDGQFWRKHLSGQLPLLELPGDYRRPLVKTYEGARSELMLDSQVLAKMLSKCNEGGESIFMMLVAVVNILLYKYSGQSDIIVGTAVAGRTHAALEDQVGFFVNTVALRTRFSSEDSFEQLLKNISRVTLDAFEHQSYPFDKLVEDLGLVRDPGRTPLFDVMVAMENVDLGLSLAKGLSGIKVEDVSGFAPVTKFDLTFNFRQTDDGLLLQLEYNTDIFKPERIVRMMHHFKNLLVRGLENSSLPVRELDYLGKEERDEILNRFNSAVRAGGQQLTVVDLFGRQALISGAATAIKFGSASISYSELNCRSNQLSWYLKNNGVGPGATVALFVGRSIDMIVAMLGVIKAGAVYVPVDPAYPPERIKFILDDCGTQTVLTDMNNRLALKGIAVGRLIQLDEIDWPALSGAASIPAEFVKNTALSYIIYTSGSTGRPKGVMVEHRNVYNLIAAQTRAFGIDQDERILQLSNYCFDASVEQIFLALTNGATLIMVDEKTFLQTDELENLLLAEQITHLHATPGFLRTITPGKYHLKRVISGGEVCTEELFDDWCQHVDFYNEYGPTETTVTATEFYNPRFTVPEGRKNNIGKPLEGVLVYIVDQDGHLCPVGVNGEICIGGLCVARGYLNRTDLTAACFVDDPFSKGGRMYRTGDIAHWSENGEIVYQGRADSQVKLRGFRIELEEIATVIREYEGISSAVVVVKGKGANAYLAGYYSSDSTIDEAGLKDYLRGRLPGYMVPGVLMKLTVFPLTSNGKLDTDALPDGVDMSLGLAGYCAPRNREEKLLVTIWEEVLGRKQIGIDNSFFDLGGHSLNAVKIAAQASKLLGKRLLLRDIFERPTIRGIAGMLNSGESQEYTPIPMAAPRPDYPLSHAQKRLWITDQLEAADRTAYNISGAYLVNGNVDKDLLERSLQFIVERHESLRTRFIIVDGEPRQKVLSFEESGFSLYYEDLRGQQDRERKSAAFGEIEVAKKFNLKSDSLIRSALLRLENEKYVFFLTVHHIVADGWSSELLFKELLIAYGNCLMGTPVQLKPLSFQYKDFTVWQNRLLQDEMASAKKQYWLKQLAGPLPVLSLPADFLRPDRKTNNGSSITKKFGRDSFSAIAAKCREEEVSMFMVVLAMVKVLLFRYTGQSDIIIGTPMAGRDHVDLADQVGYYVNTLAIRTGIEGNKSFNQVLKMVKEVALGAFEHQDYPFDKLVDDLGIHRDTSRTPIFDVMVALQNIQEGDAVNSGFADIAIEDYDSESCVSKFDLTFNFQVWPEDLSVVLEFNTDIFRRERIETMLSHFTSLLEGLLKAPERPVGEIIYLNSADIFSRVGINGWYGCGYRGGSIIEVFEESVSRYGSRACLVFGGRSMSYEELNCYSNRVGRYLREECGVVVGDLVGLLSERSEWMIVGILGIMKSGAGYVPLDPLYPEERVSYMVEDAGLKCVVRSGVFSGFSGMENVVRLEDICVSGVVDADRENIGIINEPDDVAYVIYTSGSTGRPKGCMVEHRNVLNLLKSDHDLFGFTPDDVWVMVHSFCFDFSVWEMYGALLNGGRLVIADWDTVRDTSRLYELLVREGVTVLNQTPGAFYNLIEVQKGDMEKGLKRRLRYVVFGGDKLNMWQLRDWVKEYGLDQIALINMYGITETTVHVSYYRIREEDVMREGGASVIGRSLPGVWMELLDEWGNVVPRGVIGELYVGGNGVSRGYINNKELTDLRFVEDVHSPGDKAGKLYRTGDLGRQLDEERMEYLGRKDGQVKIRGYRIELGEIESVLSSYAGVESAVVGVRGEGTDKYLVGYYRSEENIIEKDIRVYCQGKMPGYMVPLYLIRVERYPLTGNGKLDWSSLPDPVKLGLGKEELYEMARDDQERELVSIWEEILEREGIGIRDNFFELGGHSLKAIRVAGYISKRLKQQVSLKELFSHPTIAELSEVLRSKGDGQHEQIPKIEEREKYALSHAQKRLWIIDQLEGGVGGVYNIFGSYIIEGAVDREALRESLELVVDRHESLRTIFVTEQGEPYQKICSRLEVGYGLEYVDLRGELGGEEKAKELIAAASGRGFDLSQGPLIRTCLVQLEEDRYLLLLTLHHIIADGWSLWLMSNETLANYQRLTGGGGSALPELRIQYRDYAAWQNGLVGDKSMMSAHREYWTRQLSGELPVLNLPLDYPRPLRRKGNGAVCVLELPRSLQERISSKAQEFGMSVFMVLLSGVKALLYRYTGQDDIIVGTPMAGREHIDLEEQIGFYVNMLALRTRIGVEDSFEDVMRKVKEVTLGGYEHQSYPFDLLVEDLGLKRDMSRMPVFDVIVALQNVDLRAKDGYNGTSINDYEANISRNSKYDLSFAFYATDLSHGPMAGGISVALEYSTDLFKKERIERMLNHYSLFVANLIENGTVAIGKVNMLDEKERAKILHEFSAGTGFALPEKSIGRLFEEQAERTPGLEAIVYEGVSLSYRELNRRSNQFARYLIKKCDITAGDLVGVVGDRTEWMMIAILGILKAGAAYLPLDIEYPAERKRYMLVNSGAKLVVCRPEDVEGVLVDAGVSILIMDERILEKVDSMASRSVKVNVGPEAIAYVMYTSGSTGRPKGVLISHKNIVSLIAGANYVQLTDSPVLLSNSSPSFDATTFEYWMMLLNGGKLVLSPERKLLDSQVLRSEIETHRVNYMFMTPGWFNQLVDIDVDIFAGLHTLVLGGEKVSEPQIKKVLKRYPMLNVVNGYGPTESTTFSLFHRANYQDLNSTLPIGRPCTNRSVYILNDQLELCPEGVEGEICIGGKGLSLGYVGDEELTMQKFVSNPYAKGERLYRSGDIGRYRWDGSVEFVGRRDSQVKLRGHRIELGEIEVIAGGYVGLSQPLAMIGGEGSDRYIVLYYRSEESLEEGKLRKYLKERLPGYMQPAYIVWMKEYPLTINGKVDYRSLPDAVNLGRGERAEKEEKLSEVEAMVLGVWERVLGRSGIGVQDSFFELGGDSIKAIQISSGLFRLGYRLEIKDLFLYPSIKELSRVIGLVEGSVVKSEQGVVEGEVELTPVQARFFELIKKEERHHYNQSVMLYSRKGYELEGIRQVVKKLQEHHDALRMRYEEELGKIVQRNCGLEYPVEVREYEIGESGQSGEEQMTRLSEEMQRDCDLSKGPLLRAGIFRMKEGDRLLLIVHHLVIDGVSWRILFEDISSLYEQWLKGEELSLPAKTDSYRSWSLRLGEYSKSKSLLGEKAYWEQMESRKISRLGGGVIESGKGKVKDGESESFDLTEEETRSLLSESNGAYGTEINDLLLTGLGLSVEKSFGNQQVLIGLEGHGREGIMEGIDVRRTVGWFTSIYPVLLNMWKSGDLSAQIREVKQSMQSIPSKGVGYGVLRYLGGSGVGEGMKFSLEPEISFNYLGQFDTDISGQGLEVASEHYGSVQSGEIDRDYRLEVTGMVSGKRLTMSVGYNSKDYSRGEIQGLCANYQAALREIISHCKLQGHRAITPDELTYKGLSTEELENFFED